MHASDLLLAGRFAQFTAFVVVPYAVIMGATMWDRHPVMAVAQGVVWAVLSVLKWFAGRRLCREGRGA